ncbi:MAG: exodeoxyribonuclease III [Bacteroidota bacterium]
MVSIVSYNVNGIRAAAKKGFFEWLQEKQPDIVCLQEIKAQEDQLKEDWISPPGYHTYWHPAEKKGYSGTAILTKEKPKSVSNASGMEVYDKEGRILRADYEGYSVISLYVPSGSSGEHRQAIKDDFMKDFIPYLNELRKTHPNLIISGDYNVAHTEVDIHNPKSNKKTSGFLPHEREWMTELLESGFIDSFREQHPDALDAYSWWSYRANARANNKGWRIDYHLVTEPLKSKITGAGIWAEDHHSDHCPILLEMDL